MDTLDERDYCHELGHWVDCCLGITKDNNAVFNDAIDSFHGKLISKEWNDAKKFRATITKNLNDSNYIALSDFLYVASKGLIEGTFTHKDLAHSPLSEMWANLFSIYAETNHGKEEVAKLFPSS